VPARFHSAVAGDRLCGRPSVFSVRVGLLKTNLTERSPMTKDIMDVRSLVEKSAKSCAAAAPRRIAAPTGNTACCDKRRSLSMRAAAKPGL
jgi:putative transposase